MGKIRSEIEKLFVFRI